MAAASLAQVAPRSLAKRASGLPRVQWERRLHAQGCCPSGRHPSHPGPADCPIRVQPGRPLNTHEARDRTLRKSA